MSSTQWRTDRRDRSPVYRGGASRLAEFLMPWRGGAYFQGDPVGEIGGNLRPGGKHDIEEEQRLRAFGKRSRGIALTGRLKAPGNSGGVECLQGGAFAHHFDFFDCNFRTREVGHPQFVDQVYVPVRAHERYGSILHCEQERGHVLCSLGAPDRAGG